MGFVKSLVAAGELLPAFPPVYVSTDADADLGPHALERIVYRLQRKNRITGWPARVVAGALHVRGNDFWRGWRHFFTVEGQLNLQVAREYYVGNIWRYNIRFASDHRRAGNVLLYDWSGDLPRDTSIHGVHAHARAQTPGLREWLGVAPPKFSETTAAPIPELMAGDTDDTVTAYAATLARYENGPASSSTRQRHRRYALFYMLRGLLVDRALQFEPDAHVFTSSPTKAKTLFAANPANAGTRRASN